MKTIKGTLVFISIMLSTQLLSQNSSLPEVNIFTMDGTRIKANEISNEDNPMLLVFWKTFDKSGNKQIMMLNDVYNESLKEKGVKLVGICVDCKGTTDHIKPIVYGKGIEFEVYIDKNGDLRRTMNVSHIPFTILFDQEMNIVCQYPGFCPGGDEILCKKIEECLIEIRNDVY